MKKLDEKHIKIIMGGFALFLLGIFVGCQITNGSLSLMNNYLFNAAGEATWPNATGSNATSPNATSSNATSSNATSSNATSSTPSGPIINPTDNIIYLNNFSLSSTSAKRGDRISVTISTSGANNSAASIVFKNAAGESFTAQVKNLSSNPYIIVPDSALATTYSVTDVLLVGTNSNGTTFSKQYSKSGANTYSFSSTLTVIEEKTTVETPKTTNTKTTNKTSVKNSEKENKLELKSIALNNNSAKISDKIYIKVETNKQINSLKLGFRSDDNKTLTIYAKDLTTNKPYIIIPSSAAVGKYSLISATLSTSKETAAYTINGSTDTTKFDFNTTLEILEGIENRFIYNNEDITSDILTKLYNSPTGTDIVINAESNTLINKGLFDAIKGKNKKLTINYKENQIIFYGEDITDSKTIDISMTIDNVDANQKINKLVSEGIVVNFPDNGNLPGRALIRIKATNDIKEKLDNNVYVYLFKESNNKFTAIDTNVIKSSDNYYEFMISHNSDYLIVNKKLDKKLISTNDENVISFQKSNKTYLLLIGVGILTIVAVIVLIVIMKNKKMNDIKDAEYTENTKKLKKED